MVAFFCTWNGVHLNRHRLNFCTETLCNGKFEIFKKLAIIDSDNGRIHLTLADYYRENGDNNQSFEELKLAFKSTKLGIDIKIQILVSYFQLLAVNDSMRQQAEELSELLINTHKDSPKAHAVYADILYTENKFQEAKVYVK